MGRFGLNNQAIFTPTSVSYGSDLEYLRRSLGHTPVSTTQIYTDVSAADISEAYKKSNPIANLNLRSAKPKPQYAYLDILPITTVNGEPYAIVEPKKKLK